VPGYEVMSWQQPIFAPAGTPKPIVDRLHSEIAKILAEADMRERIAKLGMQGADMTIDQISEFQKPRSRNGPRSSSPRTSSWSNEHDPSAHFAGRAPGQGHAGAPSWPSQAARIPSGIADVSSAEGLS